MKKRLLGMVLLVSAMLAVPRDAAAEAAIDVQGVDGLLAALGFGALDFGLTITDVASAQQGKQLPRGYGGFETLAAGAQFGICLDNALSTRSGGGRVGGWAPGSARSWWFMES
jgi:hypothetical protein